MSKPRKPSKASRADDGHPAPPPPHLEAHHGAPPGIVCPKCRAPLCGARGAGTRDDPRAIVIRTRRRPGSIYRVRRCPACGWKVRTAERIESNRA